MGRLEGKVALITGAGMGIGAAAARRFAEEGARVVIADVNREAGAASAAAASAGAAGTAAGQHGEAPFVRTDVTDEAQVSAAVAEATGRFGRLDVLYNCAGGSIVEDTTVTEVDLSVWQHTIDLDLLGTVLCCRHAIPAIIASGGGAVVNMSSTAALQPWRAHVYSAAKGAILSLTRSLARSYAKRGVRVNAICPGYVLTERVLERFEPPDIEASRARYPFAVGEPTDIANIAVFLASDESRMVTGTHIAADGGMSNH
jgi:NAD(P)-dependent dehydrogenase (short-subunit alcohol dehydrogenase family)